MSELVDNRDGDGPGVHETPLGHPVPVELAQGPLGQVLLRGGDVVTLRQVLEDLLAQPAAGEDLGLGVGEPLLQVRHDAVVGLLRGEVGGVLFVDVFVCSACE